MYRVLAENQALRERRAQRSQPNPTRSPRWWPAHPTRCGPGTSRGSSGRRKWQYFYLYVILDIFSRYVTGWWPTARPRGWPDA